MINRYASILIAALLPLLLFRWFAPSPVGQIDFWLMWLLAMVFVALPVIYTEVALSYRSGLLLPVAGMQVLTREADASSVWRGFAWLSALVCLLIVALVVSGSAALLQSSASSLGMVLQMPIFAIASAMMVIALIISLLGERLLPVGLLLMLISMVVGLLSGWSGIEFAMTAVTLAEWGHAVALALVCVGTGTGLYWFGQSRLVTTPSSDLADSESTDSLSSELPAMVASKQVLPIWITQLLAGMIALLLSGTVSAAVAQMVYLSGVLCVSGFLLHYVGSQLSVRLGLLLSLLVTAVVSMLLVLIPASVLLILLVVFSTIAVIMLAVFAGWHMKISHLRKSLNFSSEGIYNLWRVAIRLLVPLAVLVGLMGWLWQWLA